MTELAQNKAAMLRALIEGLPSSALFRLEQMLSNQSAFDETLDAVWRMLDLEVRDRSVRDIVLAPVAGLLDGPRRVFPKALMAKLWRFLKSDHPAAVFEAEAMAKVWDPEALDVSSFDRLCLLGAEGLKADWRPEPLSSIDPSDATKLAGYLTLAPIIRRNMGALPEWVSRMGPEQKVAARLGYRDCALVSPDAGAHYFEILSSLLPEPDQVLRIISAVMDRPSERYLSDSELSGFGQRMLESIDRCLAEIKTYDCDGGIEAGRQAGRVVHRATQAIAELDSAVQLSKEGAWGQRLAQQKRSLAEMVEIHLKRIEKSVGKALPVHVIRYSARLSGKAPRVSDMPDPAELTRALSLLAFADEIRADAATGGFGATRARILDAVEKHTDPYVVDLLDLLRTGDAESSARIRNYIEAAAQILGLIHDEKAADLVRRRLAAA
jgi:hypothetical protein